MISPTQIRKPENWQDFEKLCKKLWGEILDCSSSIKRNGRNGQNQCGVDVYCLPKGEKQYVGIQCKGKDDYSQSKVTEKEIDEEIEKAKKFNPPLHTLIFATTADKDVKIEEYIRVKNIENIQRGLFNIDIASWNDIVDLLEERKSTFNWYINNCQYKDSSNVSVLFGDKEEIEVYPKYIRTEKVYSLILKEDVLFHSDWLQLNSSLTKQLSEMHKMNTCSIPSPFERRKTKYDHRWCTIPLKIYNTGSTVIEDYKLRILFDGDKVEKLDDKFQYFNPGPLYDQVIVSNENSKRDRGRQIFKSKEYFNVIEFIPTNRILVQDDTESFKIGVKSKDGIKEIDVTWILKSRDFKKTGKLLIKVLPEYEDKREIIEVETVEEVKDNEIVIIPKITEE
jgi:archaellum component FlaF (FlaF/FlaG flagellin family)